MQQSSRLHLCGPNAIVAIDLAGCRIGGVGLAVRWIVRPPQAQRDGRVPTAAKFRLPGRTGCSQVSHGQLWLVPEAVGAVDYAVCADGEGRGGEVVGRFGDRVTERITAVQCRLTQRAGDTYPGTVRTTAAGDSRVRAITGLYHSLRRLERYG